MLGVEHVRHHRPAVPEVVLRRLLALDYLLESPRTSWLTTEAEKVGAPTAAGIARDVLPRRLYQGAVGARCRYFLHKLPVGLDGSRATFVFPRTRTRRKVRSVREAHSIPRSGRASPRPAARSR